MAKGKIRTIRAPAEVWERIDGQAIDEGISANMVAVRLLAGARGRARRTPSPRVLPDEDPGEVIGRPAVHRRATALSRATKGVHIGPVERPLGSLLKPAKGPKR